MFEYFIAKSFHRVESNNNKCGFNIIDCIKLTNSEELAIEWNKEVNSINSICRCMIPIGDKDIRTIKREIIHRIEQSYKVRGVPVKIKTHWKNTTV